MLRRNAEDTLFRWFESNRRKPLILRGARQVGKSTLVQKFARNIEKRLITINCEKHLYLDSLFKKLDIPAIIRELEALAGNGPLNSESILFLDEIQATPHALQALRYFYEEFPEIAVISAGSLIEFTLSNHNFSIPVGRIQYLYLGPMTFKEFVHSIEPDKIAYLEGISFSKKIPEAAHESLCKLQRLYLFIGGMPEAVALYAKSKSLQEVQDVHREIIETYIDDFAKYAKQKDLALLQRIFSSVPGQLGKKIKYTNLAEGERAALVRAQIDILIKALVVTPIWHTHASGIPLIADIDDSVFKLAFLDVGLANFICGISWQDISNRSDIHLVNEGGIAEQFVSQELLRLQDRKPVLTYWQRDGKNSNAEVDFIFSIKNQIIPVEVKAGKSGTLKSIHQFVFHKKINRAIRFDLNQASKQTVKTSVKTKDDLEEVSLTLFSLPLYAVSEIHKMREPFD